MVEFLECLHVWAASVYWDKNAGWQPFETQDEPALQRFGRCGCYLAALDSRGIS
jgi:hypothetical protein